MRSILSSLLFVILAMPALAAEGVQEINQTCAVQTGCFQGDSPGFPVTISSAGSYVLTSNLEIGGSAGITATDDVTLDLNGFSVVATGGAVSGVSGGNRFTLRNGNIRGTGGNGVSASAYAIIDGVRVDGAGANGITAGIQSLIRGCVVRSSTEIGISAGTASVVESNSVVLSGAGGIQLTTGVVRRNGVVNNGPFGISIGISGIVVDNEIRIAATALLMGANVGYAQNQITGAVSGGVEIGTNLCNGNTTCP